MSVGHSRLQAGLSSQWCLILSPLSFHLCYNFPLLTFQANPVRQTDHHCPAETSPLSKDNLSINLFIFLMNSNGFLLLFSKFLFILNVVMQLSVSKLCAKYWHCCRSFRTNGETSSIKTPVHLFRFYSLQTLSGVLFSFFSVVTTWHQCCSVSECLHLSWANQATSEQVRQAPKQEWSTIMVAYVTQEKFTTVGTLDVFLMTYLIVS